jgi:hypothetical protein
MHYTGLRVHREFVIHFLFGRTKISYEVTLDMKHSLGHRGIPPQECFPLPLFTSFHLLILMFG